MFWKSRFVVVLSIIISTHCCTEFIIQCNDSATVVGRSMEWGPGSYIIVSEPNGTKYTARVPKSCEESNIKTWTSIADQLNVVNSLADWLHIDGMNSYGLSASLLYFREYAEYPEDVPEDKCTNAISHLQISSYVLGNYQNVNEVREAIKTDYFPYIWGEKLIDPWIGKMILHPLHWSFIDGTGDAIVLEYTKEGRKVHDNIAQVFTNAPAYDWHVLNLNNYVNLQQSSFPTKMYGKGYKMIPFGKGTGLLGVPGDFTPPSRFIRTFAMVHFAGPAKNATSGVNQAFHIINSVDITNEVSPPEKTIWSLVKDLKNNILYYRGYNYLSIRKIELNSVTRKKEWTPIDDQFEDSVEDMTAKMSPYKQKAAPCNNGKSASFNKLEEF